MLSLIQKKLQKRHLGLWVSDAPKWAPEAGVRYRSVAYTKVYVNATGTRTGKRTEMQSRLKTIAVPINITTNSSNNNNNNNDTSLNPTIISLTTTTKWTNVTVEEEVEVRMTFDSLTKFVLVVW